MQPLCDDGSPVVDPGLDEVQIIAANKSQQRVAASHDAAEWRTGLAALGFDFSLGGGRCGEQGSAVEEDSVEVELAQKFVERAFNRPVVEVVAMADLDGKRQLARQALKITAERFKLPSIERRPQLQKRRAEPAGVVQDRQQIEERRGLGFGRDELLVVTDRARKFEREPESGSGLVCPAMHCVSARQSVERAVPFDGVEDAAVLSQKLTRLGIGRKERTDPRGTRPDRTTQE